MTLFLASASSERRRILRQAGVEPVVRPSHVDELAERAAWADARGRALHLAACKARAVAGSVDDGLVLGADSVLVANGTILDKPRGLADILEWWRGYRGQELTVSTGHCLVRARDGELRSEAAVGRVEVALPTDAELYAYASRAEVLGAAGGFILDGPSAPFVGTVSGDAGAISGLSMSTVRRLALSLGYDMCDLWAEGASQPD